MGIFDKIKGAIWGHHEKPAAQVTPQAPRTASAGSTPSVTQAAPSGGTQTAQAAPGSSAPHPASTPAPTAGSSSNVPAAGTSTSTPAAPASASPSASSGSVDVAAIMDAAVKSNGQKLDWRHSIVDMMKALDLDSSLSSRKELAKELNYSGDTEDSAKMNMWLHKALMQKLKENGGKVPAELAD